MEILEVGNLNLPFVILIFAVLLSLFLGFGLRGYELYLNHKAMKHNVNLPNIVKNTLAIGIFFIIVFLIVFSLWEYPELLIFLLLIGAIAAIVQV